MKIDQFELYFDYSVEVPVRIYYSQRPFRHDYRSSCPSWPTTTSDRTPEVCTHLETVIRVHFGSCQLRVKLITSHIHNGVYIQLVRDETSEVWWNEVKLLEGTNTRLSNYEGAVRSN